MFQKIKCLYCPTDYLTNTQGVVDKAIFNSLKFVAVLLGNSSLLFQPLAFRAVG